jgi:hypothetical protein
MSLIGTPTAAFRTVVTEAGDRENDEPGVEFLQRRDPEPEPLEHAGTEVLDQDVGAAYQVEQHLAIAIVFEVEGDRLFVSVGREKVRRFRP